MAVSTPGFNGRWLFFYNGDKSFVRDIVNHRTTKGDLQTVSYWRANRAAICGNVIVALTDNGRCAVQDLSGKGHRVVRENVFSVEIGAREGQYIASSNSVRLYDAQSHANGEEVFTGNRVTRYENGVLNFFFSENSPVRRVREDDFSQVGTPPHAQGEGYTYNGRWCMRRRTKKGKSLADLISLDGTSPPVQLPIVPDIWSCGKDTGSIAVWRHAPCEMIAFNGKTGKVRWRRTDIKGVNSNWVSPDGSRLYVALEENKVSVYDMENGKLLGNLNSHNVGPINLTFSADTRFAFTCGGDGRAVMWDTVSLKKVGEFRGNEQTAVSSADISSDGKRVLTANRSGAWQLWDASNGVQLLDVHVSFEPLTSALFCADGRRIVTAGDDGRVRVWRTVDADPTTNVPIDPRYLSKLHL